MRQPLQKIMIPILNEQMKGQVEAIKELVLAEVNVKELEYMSSDSGILVKRVKPNFKTLGPKYGKDMRLIAEAIAKFSDDDIKKLEEKMHYSLFIENQEIVINIEDVEITTEDIPGWAVASINGNTVALDISISKSLQQEGLARELINRIQTLRKDIGLEVTDKIEIQLSASEELTLAINENLNYICSETLANRIEIVELEALVESHYFELISDINTNIKIIKR